MKNIKKISSLQADSILLLVAFMWGSGFVVTKNTLKSMAPMHIMFLRFLLATVIAAIIFRKHLKEITKTDVKYGLLMALFLSTGFTFQTIGLQYTTVGKQAFITGTNVVMVPFMYWFISKTKPAMNNVIAAALTFLGIGLLTLDFNNHIYMNKGDIYTLICAVFFAVHVALTGHFVKDRNPFAINIIQLGFCTIFFLIASIVMDGTSINITKNGLMSVLYLGIFTTMLCFSMQTFAQKFTLPTHAAIILSLESVFGSLLGVLILKENFTPFMVIGCITIFLAIITAETGWKFLNRKRE